MQCKLKHKLHKKKETAAFGSINSYSSIEYVTSNLGGNVEDPTVFSRVGQTHRDDADRVRKIEALKHYKPQVRTQKRVGDVTIEETQPTLHVMRGKSTVVMAVSVSSLSNSAAC